MGELHAERICIPREGSAETLGRPELRPALPSLRRAGIVGASWHSLRHTAATRRILAGASLYGVQQLLGHKDIQTTARYSHLTPGFMQETVSKGSLFGSGENELKDGTGSKIGSAYPINQGGLPQPIDFMVRPVGIEPTTLSLEG